MNQLTFPTETMTSKEIAELTGKLHKNVLRDIDGMAAQISSELSYGLQSSTYTDNGRTYPMYVLDQDTTLLLLTGYDVTARMKVIKRWRELESKHVPLSYKESLKALIAMEEEKEALLLEVVTKEGIIKVQDNVIEYKKVLTNESNEYISVQRVKELNPTLKLSGRKLTRRSNAMGFPVVPLYSNYNMISPMTYHTAVWVAEYPTINLP